ncbi:hypothetical protein [Polymorphum gilvum]|uniref:Uncharacterized protein n=1 Tax=Polymorphum gilvum (strain LMG 25793 / CGMCC 1.9160 / SL003B-26A1) TaxID=991905 RepID=F2J0Q2_POLGS|nr:hypothetical protein [Polymorphum gilvum]ADZ70738.1 hypothetical protein SL003B_2313 [Polymorphum gilvum SL003B-26A1]
MISRENGSRFRGSHQILKAAQAGYYRVRYCDQEYWVLPRTVAWAEKEAARGYTLRVEFSRGRGWVPLCESPQTQVRLTDLGLGKAAEQMTLSGLDPSSGRQNRLTTIRRAFNPR